MEYQPSSRITIFVGGYGSGKSEIALNLAIRAARGTGGPVPALIDLDVVKPMFRTREHMAEAAALGIEIVAPEGDLALFELPALNPKIHGILRSADRPALVDVGGDDRGARALGSLRDLLPADHDLLLVVNARRPFSADPDGMVQVAREIEAACRLKLTGLVSNTHLAEWTDREVILEGNRVASEAARRLGVPVRFAAARADLVGGLPIAIPVLPLDLRFCLPWERRAAG